MTVKITVSRKEFNQAKSNGTVWGRYLYETPKLFVYAELGTEREYIPKYGDDLRTDYRIFTNCYVEYYRTMEDLKSGNVIEERIEDNVAVIICC